MRDEDFFRRMTFCPHTAAFTIEEVVFVFQRPPSWVRAAVNHGSLKLSGSLPGRELHRPSAFAFFDLIEFSIALSVAGIIGKEHASDYSTKITDQIAELYEYPDLFDSVECIGGRQGEHDLEIEIRHGLESLAGC